MWNNIQLTTHWYNVIVTDMFQLQDTLGGEEGYVHLAFVKASSGYLTSDL